MELPDHEVPSRFVRWACIVIVTTIAIFCGVRASAYTGSWPPSASLTDTKAVVPISATVSVSPASITLNFPRPGAYAIYRKDPQAGQTTSGSSNPWGSPLVTLPAGSTTWTDTTVSVGQLYEYEAICTDGSIIKQVPNPITFTSGSAPPVGYIVSGINVDETQPRGRIIVVVATDLLAAIPNDIAQYEADLAADGWYVHVIPVSPSATNFSVGTTTLAGATYEVTPPNALSTVTVVSSGTGYVSGTGGVTDHTGYVALASQSGSSIALASITTGTSGGNITAVNLVYPGGGFTVGGTLTPVYLTANSLGLPSGTTNPFTSGSGAVFTVGSVTTGSSNPVLIRNQIMAIYNQYPGQVKNVVLLGKVPACRTGAGYVWDPDGHGENLAGYGADGYYANMTGTWTDTASDFYWFYYEDISGGQGTTNNIYWPTTGCMNLPGDGKFDQYYMSQTGGEADMGFGRIDLSNAIDGQYSAVQAYLQKLHRYKVASPDFRPGRGVAERTGFSNTDETAWECAVAISGSLGNVTLVPAASLPAVTNSFDADAAWTAQNGPFLFYFKGDGGPGNSVGGKAVFWTGMQSHWGWWYSSAVSSSQNDMALRLGENSMTLSFTWDIFGLRYFYHRMAMGFDAGDMMRVSVNNYDGINGTYRYVSDPTWNNLNNIEPCAGGLFMNHFGDPALRLYMFTPPSNLSVTGTGGNPVLNWTASTEPTVTGYHVYRTQISSGTLTGPAIRVTSTPVTGTTYTDTSIGAGSGQWSYMVRAVRLETSGAGTYYNASLGVSQTIDMTNGPTTLAITSSGTLPSVNWNTAYPTMLAAQGGTPPYSWTVISGSVPPGMSLTTTGSFAGTPTTAGTYSFVASATDVLGQTAQQSFTMPAMSNNAITLLPEMSSYEISTSATRIQGATEAIQVSPSNISLLRFNLAGLNLNNSLVSATLRMYVGAGTTLNSNALIQAALTQDAAGAAWNVDSVNWNTIPPDNTSVTPTSTSTFPVIGSYVTMDVTPQLRAALSGTSGKMSLRLFTNSTQTVYLCSAYSYGTAIPVLTIQTTNAPNIVINSPATNPAYLYVNSGLQINATVTTIPANAANLTTRWTQVSGPGTATFSSASTPSTAVTFSAPGDYVLQLAANDGVLQSSQTITVRVLSVPAGTTPVTGLATNMVLRLPLDETSGTIANDYSGVTPANSGTLMSVSGTVLVPWSGTLAPTWAPTGGKIGGALPFSGTGQQVMVPDSATNLLDGMSQMSISCWFYANSITSTGTFYNGLVSKRVKASNNESYAMGIRGGAGPTYSMYFDAGHTLLVSSVKFTTGKWFHVVEVFDGTLSTNNLKLYVNGQPDTFSTSFSSGTTTVQTSVPRNSTANLHIGAYDASDTLGWVGLIDEVRIYNTALTLSQVQDLYNAVPGDMGPQITLANTVSGTTGQAFPLSATVTSGGTSALSLGWVTASGPTNAVFSSATSASTNATCSLTGTYTLQLSASDGTITTFGNITASITGQSFSSWASSNGLSGGMASPTASPAGDGVSNLIKYALGLNPNVPSVKATDGTNPGLPLMQINAGNLTLTYQKDTSKTDITYTVQTSTDLMNWTTSGITLQVMSTNGNIQTIQASVPQGSNAKEFIRLNVTH